MDIQRRRVLTAVAAAVPALAVVPRAARAWTTASAEDVGLIPATGTWAVLEHVTDGTDASTSVIAPPKFTPEIRKLAGTEVTLTGYLQPAVGGFGKKQDYLLSRNTFHCPYCYPFGRGSLALTTIDGHAPAAGKKVTVKGTLALQETDPSDFYFQLKNARIV
jgi:uncharacterized protein